MKIFTILFVLIAIVLRINCEENTSTKLPIISTTNGPQTKPIVFIHMMPWFDTKATNAGKWGGHWASDGKDPDVIKAGKREIGSKYYPLIDLYASSDSHVIDWQLGLMKLSGVTGILIDWYGSANINDYPIIRRNTEAIIKGCERIGLEFGIVYEDQTLKFVEKHDKNQDFVTQGKADMTYLRDNYFKNKNYVHINGAPLLLCFGPQALFTAKQWSDIFTVFKQKPTFLPLWDQPHDLGADGEFAWVYKTYLDGLSNFYKNRNVKIKFGSAYPGFDPLPDRSWNISVSIDTFEKTLDLALSSGVKYIQVATWNDYGEGTMIEPTLEFGYGFLTTLQKKLGVNHTQADLEQVTKVFHQRKYYSTNNARLAKLDQAFDALLNSEPHIAREILDNY